MARKKGQKRSAGKDEHAAWGEQEADLGVKMAEDVPPEKRAWQASGWAIVLEPLLALVNDEGLWARVHARHVHQERMVLRGDARGIRERLRGEFETWTDAVQDAFLDNNPDHALGLWMGALPVMRDARMRAEGKAHRDVLEAAIEAETDEAERMSLVAARDLLYAFDPLLGEGPYAGPAALAIALHALTAYRVPTLAEEEAAEAAWAEEKKRREGELELERARRGVAAMQTDDELAVTDPEVSSDDDEYSDEDDSGESGSGESGEEGEMESEEDDE